MDDPVRKDDEGDDEARRDEILKRMLKTPPATKEHSNGRGEKKDKPQPDVARKS